MVSPGRPSANTRRRWGTLTELTTRGRELLGDRVLESRAGSELAVLRHRDDRFDVVLFFSGMPAQQYQVRMWLGPLEHLAQHLRVAILCREARHAVELSALTDLPVRMSRRAEECNSWIDASGARLVLYVNQNTQNFQTLRLRRPAHAHLSHGESEKVSMVSNQLKAYDRVFTAGVAARERILEHLVEFDAAAFVDVGRPQIDLHDHDRHLPSSERTTVLYAPTWEGDSPAMAYGSVASQGERIAAAVLASRDHRLVYRAHPQTGSLSKPTRAADQAIRALVDRANAADPAAGHVTDTGAAFGWQLDEADACVCDVSAVAFDWLATGKPLVLTGASGDAESVGPTTARLTRLGLDDTDRLLELLATESDPAHHEAMAALVTHHFGDTSPGASLQRFVDACTTTVAHRRELLGEG